MAIVCVVAENKAKVKCFKADSEFKAGLKVIFIKAKWKKPHSLQNRL